MNDHSDNQAREVIERHSRSFALAARLLPAEVGRDVKKLYAWCRACDNAVDEAENSQAAKQQVQQLRADVRRIYQGLPPELPESAWLADVVSRHQIPQQWPLDLLAGMESDIDFVPFDSVEKLEHYCYQAAGVVGLMMSQILGVKETKALRYANSLGIAMQMTNIARDVAEDRLRGRCYLPQVWLDAAQTTPSKPQTHNPSQVEEAIPHAVKRLLERAEFHYRKGELGYPFLPPPVRPAIRVAALVYREIGGVIARNHYRVTQKRHFVSTSTKAWLLAKVLLSEFWKYPKFPGLLRKKIHAMEKISMNKENVYLATFGLCLSLVMATAMFALVGLNPKMDSYQHLPWMYAILSASGAIGLGWFSRHLGRQLDQAVR